MDHLRIMHMRPRVSNVYLLVWLALLALPSFSAADTCYNLGGGHSECRAMPSPGPFSPPPPPPPPDPEQQKRTEFNNLKILGNTALKKGNWESAIDFFKKALKLYPENASILKDLDFAQTQIQRRKAVDWHEKGRAYLEQGNHEMAIATFEKALGFFNFPETRKQLNQAKRERRRAEIQALEHRVQDEQERVGQRMGSSLDRVKSRLSEKANGTRRRSAMDQLRQMQRDGTGSKGKGYSDAILELNAGKKKSGCTVDGSCGSDAPHSDIPSLKPDKPALPEITASAVPYTKVLRALDKNIASLDQKIRKTKDPGKKQRFLKAQIHRLNEKSGILKSAVQQEKDPVKKGALINQQTAIKSKIGVKEIQILDLSVKPPGQ